MEFHKFASELAKADNLVDKQKLIEQFLDAQVGAVNPFLYWTDSYKVSHISFQVDGVKRIYSNATVRFAGYLKDMLGDYFSDEYVSFGQQYMMLMFHMRAKKGFFDRPKDEVMAEMREVHKDYIGNERLEQFEKLHDLGYIPLLVKSIDEGTVVPVGLPFYTIENTLPEFEWLANYLESGMSTDTWKQLTVATVAMAFRKISLKYAKETVGNTDFVDFQNHDFSTRGQANFESGGINGVGFLLSSKGTDNLPALHMARLAYFSANTEFGSLAGSVPAGEHSVTTLGINAIIQRELAESGVQLTQLEAEMRYARWLMEDQFPSGIMSYVADSYDYWGFITEVLPKLKETIMARDGKFVVRGDSGNPVHIIAGYRIVDLDGDVSLKGQFVGIDHALLNTHKWWKNGVEVVKLFGKYYSILDGQGRLTASPKEILEAEAIGTIQSLWNIFYGTVNELGFKELDSHIGMIYGDGITVHRSDEILSRLKEKGFASSNIVFGVGSYSLNMLSRDHLGIAIKATNALIEIDGEDVEMPIYKDPKTDTSKKSDKGYLVVVKDKDGKLIKKDMQSRKAMLEIGELTTLYMNGQFHKFTDVGKIRKNLWG